MYGQGCTFDCIVNYLSYCVEGRRCDTRAGGSVTCPTSCQGGGEHDPWWFGEKCNHKLGKEMSAKHYSLQCTA